MSNDLPSDGHKVVSKGYKYFMVFLCMLTQAIPYGIAQLIQPLFVHPLVNTFHFTLASYTLIFTFGAVVGSLVSPMVGKALQKVNFKILYLIGICLSAGAYVIFGISTKLPGFYLAGIICMVGSTFYSGQGVPWIINHWFPFKGRGVALGLAFCGGSIGDIFLQPITQAILKHFMTGNTKTGHLTSMAPFYIFAVALLVVGLIIAAFIRVPKKDEDVASAEEIKKNRHEAAQKHAHEFQGWSGKQVLHMKWFWIFSMGWAVTSGLSVFSYMSGPAFMAKSLFGAKAQGVNLGYISLAYAIGFAIGAPLFGVIKGVTSFTTAWWSTIFFVAIGFILLIFAAIKIKQIQKNIVVNKPNIILDK